MTSVWNVHILIINWSWQVEILQNLM